MSLRNGAVLVDIDLRALHFWSEDGTHLQALSFVGAAVGGSDAAGAHAA